ncbi:hypothetical protein J6590_055716 [Homalodisca vitripennis]|nr:hypothetical protein J6590_055716 [Homalodisca vitripennis]
MKDKKKCLTPDYYCLIESRSQEYAAASLIYRLNYHVSSKSDSDHAKVGQTVTICL